MHTLDRRRIRQGRQAIKDLLRPFGRRSELWVTVGTDPVAIRVSREVTEAFLDATSDILVDPEAGQDARGLNLVAACGRQREQLRRVGRAYGRSAAGPQVGNMCGVQLALYENGRCGAVGPEHLLVGRSALARCRCQDPAVVGEIVRILWHVAGEPFAGSLLSFSAVRKGSSSIVL